jgi:hypothetical protein
LKAVTVILLLLAEAMPVYGLAENWIASLFTLDNVLFGISGEFTTEIVSNATVGVIR